MRQVGVYMGVSRLIILREAALNKPYVGNYGSDKRTSIHAAFRGYSAESRSFKL